MTTLARDGERTGALGAGHAAHGGERCGPSWMLSSRGRIEQVAGGRVDLHDFLLTAGWRPIAAPDPQMLEALTAAAARAIRQGRAGPAPSAGPTISTRSTRAVPGRTPPSRSAAVVQGRAAAALGRIAVALHRKPR